jgi:hypothetical protein
MNHFINSQQRTNNQTTQGCRTEPKTRANETQNKNKTTTNQNKKKKHNGSHENYPSLGQCWLQETDMPLRIQTRELALKSFCKLHELPLVLTTLTIYCTFSCQ